MSRFVINTTLVQPTYLDTEPFTPKSIYPVSHAPVTLYPDSVGIYYNALDSIGAEWLRLAVVSLKPLNNRPKWSYIKTAKYQGYSTAADS